MLYQAYQAQRDVSAVPVALAGLWGRMLDELPGGWSDHPLIRQVSAPYRLAGRARLTHERPAYGLTTVEVAGRDQPAFQQTVAVTPFASLLRFSIPTNGAPRPKVLLVTALAGHFSTLPRDTIRSLVADHKVYVTDWRNARDVPVEDGAFGLDDYIDLVIGFLEQIGPGAHVVAVCQPCPATLAAVSVMAAADNPSQPQSMTLIAGPIDTRVNPTKVNDLAHTMPLSWFERSVITTVPRRYPGRGRKVYPGFLQVGGFMSMNAPRHLSQHIKLYEDLVFGRKDDGETITDFYDEYFTVLDMPAEFYLQTADRVFQRHLLPDGKLTWRGQAVDPAAIKTTALLTVEGENDDICGIGQTMAAHDLCTGLDEAQTYHHLQPGVGHYGVFSGRQWEQTIYPTVRDFIQTYDG